MVLVFIFAMALIGWRKFSRRAIFQCLTGFVAEKESMRSSGLVAHGLPWTQRPAEKIQAAFGLIGGRGEDASTTTVCWRRQEAYRCDGQGFERLVPASPGRKIG